MVSGTAVELALGIGPSHYERGAPAAGEEAGTASVAAADDGADAASAAHDGVQAASGAAEHADAGDADHADVVTGAAGERGVA